MSMESKPTWKGTDKPGGSEFYVPSTHKHERDCPACRYGTIKNCGQWLCIDCGAKFSAEALEKIEKAKK